MTELPKSLRDAMEKAAKKWDAKNNSESDFYCSVSFNAGAQWLYSHLLSQAPEFDEYKDELQELAQSYSKVCGHEREAFIEGARHQHAQTSAIYKIREARRDEEIQELKAKLAQKDAEVEEMRLVGVRETNRLRVEACEEALGWAEEVERLKAEALIKNANIQGNFSREIEIYRELESWFDLAKQRLEEIERLKAELLVQMGGANAATNELWFIRERQMPSINAWKENAERENQKLAARVVELESMLDEMNEWLKIDKPRESNSFNAFYEKYKALRGDSKAASEGCEHESDT
jgi:uncharacterized small protein (DUF1192 family)